MGVGAQSGGKGGAEWVGGRGAQSGPQTEESTTHQTSFRFPNQPYTVPVFLGKGNMSQLGRFSPLLLYLTMEATFSVL